MKKHYTQPIAQVHSFAKADVLVWSNKAEGYSDIGFDASTDLNWN
jgi:hypothetical protein